MKNSQTIKILLIILISSTFIISFASFGVLAYEKVTNQNKVFPKDAVLAGIDLSRKNQEEAAEILQSEIDAWRSESILTLNYKEITEEFDLKAFNFNIDESLSSLSFTDSDKLQVSVHEDEFTHLLEIADDEGLIEAEGLRQGLLDIAAQLKPGKTTLNITDYLVAEPQKETIVSTSLTVEDKDQALSSFAREFAQIELEAYEELSLLQEVSDSNLSNYSDEALSIIASLLYEAILQTNFTLGERNISVALPDYAKLGYEAAVSKERELDFSFFNPNDLDYEFEITYLDNVLKIDLQGQAFKYNYRPLVKNREKIDQRTIIQFSPALNYGDYEVKEAGKAGESAQVNRQTVDKSGQIIKQEDFANDYYEPVHRIEIHSLVGEQVN